MALFKCLLDVAVRIQYDFIAWHQRQHLQHPSHFKCKTCSIGTVDKYQKIVLPNRVMNINVVHPTLFSNLNTLSQRFINIVKHRKGLTRLDVSNIAISLLSFCNSRNTITAIDDLVALSTCIFKFYETTKTFNAEFIKCTITREDQVETMRRLFNTEIPFNSNMSSAIYKMLLTDRFLPDMCISLLIRRIYNRNDLLANLLDDCKKDEAFELTLSEHVKSLICLTSHDCNAVLSIDDDYRYSVFCSSCSCDFITADLWVKETKVILPIPFVENDALSDYYMNNILKLIQSTQLLVRLNVVQCLPAICYRHSHVLCSAENLHWTNAFNDNELASKFQFLQIVPRIIDAINVSSTNISFVICENFPFRFRHQISTERSKIVPSKRAWRNY